jgi:prepilin-type processing-associated H-X9-DG protein
MQTKGVNMLFVDGHANPVTPEEAWIAIRGGGIDIRQ